MVPELRRILRIRPQILLDVIVRNLLKRVVLWSPEYAEDRRQQERSCDGDFHRIQLGVPP
jgi:hypothetical protein